ncbi:Aldo/keto reductase [Meredithblackwellia eburnea MCA 4105]
MPFDKIKLSSGTSIPGIAFGTGSDWRANPRAVDDDGVSSEVVEAVKAAADAGFRAFDTAENYRNEKSLGRALKELNLPREEFFVTSKISHSIDNPEKEIRRQLDLLQLDHLDLYLIHSPINVKGSFLETWKAMEALVAAGLTKAIGVSNFEKRHFELFISEAKIKPAVNQISVYPYVLEKQSDIISYCKQHDIVIQAYEVSSSIIRKTEQGGPIDPVLEEISKELSAAATPVTTGQVLLSWASAKQFVPVTTSSKPSRMKVSLSIQRTPSSCASNSSLILLVGVVQLGICHGRGFPPDCFAGQCY